MNNENIEDLSDLYDELYDNDGNYIGPKKTDPNKLESRLVRKDRIDSQKDFEITPSNIRSHFLKRSVTLLDDYIDRALGLSMAKSQDVYAQTQVWEILKQMILEAKNPAPLVDIKGKTIDEQVDKILTLSSTGKITLEEAKDFLSLIQQGFEMTELPALMAKMEKLESLGYDN